MGIKATEVGQPFRVGTTFDLSAATSMTIKYTSDTGVETIIPTARVTAPSSEEAGFPANTFMKFITEAADFTEDGDYTEGCGTYNNTNLNLVLFTNKFEFTIDEAC